jgi:MFS family permease
MLADGASFSVMVGIGESYLPAFALALGMGELVGGLISTVPLLVGATLQLVSPAMVRRMGSYRRWVVLCATLQAASFLPLLAAALVGSMPVALLFLLASLYWGAGLAAGPTWNTWAESLVPKGVRAHYFARRTRITQAGVLLGFLAGGFSLQAGAAWGHPLWAFAVIFLVAAACRSLSAAFIASQREPHPPNGEDRHVAPRELLSRLIHNKDGRLLLYLLGVYGSVQIAGPLFNPYMLKHLELSYGSYALLVASAFLAKTLALPAWGRLARRWGALRLLWLGGVAIVPLSAGWILSSNYAWLVALQVFGGAGWAAFELAMLLLFFEAIPKHERTSVLTTYNLAYAAANVGGTIVGCVLWKALGSGPAAYLTVFGLSSAARLVTLGLLWRVRDTRQGVVVSLPTRTLAVRPEDASVSVPVLTQAERAAAGAAAEVPAHDVAAPTPVPAPVVLPMPEPVRRPSWAAAFSQVLR